jgi:TPR repeat protein
MIQRPLRHPFVLTVAAALGGCAPAALETAPNPPATQPTAPAPAAELSPAAQPSAQPSAQPAKKPDGVAWTPGLTGENAEQAKACDAGDYGLCMTIGNLYELGPQKDLPRALAVYKLGCDGGDKGACMNVGRMLLDGVGTAADVAKGTSILTNACEEMKNAEACYLLGERYDKGPGVEKDPGKAKDFYGKACDNHFTNGCQKAGRKSKP